MYKLKYRGVTVLTTAQIAQAYGVRANNLVKNFASNPTWFEEGKHYFKLEGAELNAAKMLLGTERPRELECLELIEEPDDEMLYVPKPSVGKRARALMLWTRRGIMRHASCLTTPKAVNLFDQMCDAIDAQAFDRILFTKIDGERSESGDKSVYVLDFEDRVKIGVTGDVEKRIRTIECASGTTVVRHWQSAPLTKEDALRVERAAHAQFARARLKGEYFAVEYQDAVDAVQNCL